MTKEKLVQALIEKKEPEHYIAELSQNPLLIEELFSICEQNTTPIHYQAEKVIRFLSKKTPTLVYPYFDRMVALLNSDNHFLQWGFLMTIPNLLGVDQDKKWLAVREQFLSFLTSQEVVAFSNVVKGVPQILSVYQEEEDIIVPQLLAVSSHTFLNHGRPSSACLEVAKSHIIDCFTRLYSNSNYQVEMMSFIKECCHSSRQSVVNKAEKFLKKYSKIKNKAEKN